jgi:hypothetical protein
MRVVKSEYDEIHDKVSSVLENKRVRTTKQILRSIKGHDIKRVRKVLRGMFATDLIKYKEEGNVVPFHKKEVSLIK